MPNVATATPGLCSVRYMPPVSARALPREQNERLRAGFRVHVISLGAAGAAASTATDLWVPRTGDRYERRAVTLHEMLHGVLARRGEDRSEADVWMATAAWVVRAMLHPSGYGLILYPPWLVQAAPPAFWQGV